MIETYTCKCGAPVRREIPDDWSKAWQTMLRRIPAMCDPCIAEAEAADQAAEAAERVREVEQRRQRRVSRAGIPLALRGLRWEDLDMRGRAPAIASAREWAAGELPGLVLTGEIGVGKTRIAATAAWAYLGRRPMRWTSMPILFARLGAGHNDQARRAALELLTGTDALVLDDLDKARPTEYGAEQVFAVVDNRITESAPLLVTTNLSFDELADKFPDPFGEAIVSRLAGYCRAERITGRDRRLPGMRVAA